MDAGGKEGFIGVHVADTGEKGLVAEHSLDHSRALCQKLGQNLSGEIWLQGLRTELAHDRGFILYQPHHTQFAGIAKAELGSIVEMENSSKVRVRFRRGGVEQQRAAHPEMQD
jgi:hypothetical protein